MRSSLAIIVVLMAIASVAACATDKAYSTDDIYVRYRRQLDEMEPGLPLAKFRRLLPDAYVAGQTIIGETRVDAYEVINKKWNRLSGATEEQALWFYFANKQLVKWGRPGDWPSPADLVIEVR